MMTKRVTFLKGEYTGYQGALDKLAVDKELTQVGPGTPGGEYLRRFWHQEPITPLGLHLSGHRFRIITITPEEITAHRAAYCAARILRHH